MGDADAVRELWRRCAAAVCVGVLVVALGACAQPEEKSAAEPRAAVAKPKNGTTTVKKRESIPYETRTQRSTQLKKGARKVSQRGRDGVRMVTWRITTKNGKVVERKRVKTVVVRKPQVRIVLVGTRVGTRAGTTQTQGSCNLNYSPCVPAASDADCAGGGGDGPVFVSQPVRVIGGDPYDLDSDGDGWGCAG